MNVQTFTLSQRLAARSGWQDFDVSMTMKHQLLGLIALAAGLQVAVADSWYFPPEKTVTKHEFQEFAVHLVRDTISNPIYPIYTTELYRSGKLVATINDTGFTKVFASKENRFFLVVSDLGITPQAAKIFSSEGVVLCSVKFQDSRLHFCELTTTIVRKWYDKDDPAVEFVIEGDKLKRVVIKGCNGDPVKFEIE